VVLIEACLLSGWVRDLCEELGSTFFHIPRCDLLISEDIDVLGGTHTPGLLPETA
jgi:hypothetical protein